MSDTKFRKGQSGNPKGRKKGTPNKATAEIQELTRKHAPEAVQRLVDLMRDREHPGHVTAIKELLDRGYGKPKQAHEHTGKDGAPFAVNVSIGSQSPPAPETG